MTGTVHYEKNPFNPHHARLKNSMDKLAGAKFIYSNLQIIAQTTPELFVTLCRLALMCLKRRLCTFSSANGCAGFDIGGITIPCSYKGIVGGNTMAMYLNNYMINHISREVWGEPKRNGTAQMYHYRNDMYAYCELNGERLCEIEAEPSENVGPI